MTTDRWVPTTVYSDSVRSRPGTTNSLSPLSPPSDQQHHGHGQPALVSSEDPVRYPVTGPKMDRRTTPPSTDIPVHPDLEHITTTNDNTSTRLTPITAQIESPPPTPATPSTEVRTHSGLSPYDRKRTGSFYPPIDQQPTSKAHRITADGISSTPKPGSTTTPTLCLQDTGLLNSHEPQKQESSSKPRSTRGSKACTVCRRVKMRCVGAENGPPCKRCRLGEYECIFEESQRGKKGTKRTDILARNLQTVEEKLEAVMSKIQSQTANTNIPPPTAPIDHSVSAHQLTSGYSPTTLPSSVMLLGTSTCSDLASDHHQPHAQSLYQDPSSILVKPTPVIETAQSLPHVRFGALPDFSQPSSPRLHSLPDNTLNPLGLLAEASLRNRYDRQRSERSSSDSRRRNSSLNGRNGRPATGSGKLSSELGNELAHGVEGDHDGPHSPKSPLSFGSLPQSDEGEEPTTGSQHHHRTTKANKRKVGVANHAYFQPTPANILPLRRIVIEQKIPPSLLTDKVLSNEEAEELFRIFFERCNPHCCILESTLHTPTVVGSRSPFLFTAICAVASRYYEKRKELHLNCLQAAKRIAFDVMVKGYKSVEVVQSFLLLSLWNQPAERFEEDRTWAFSGIAIRMAIDLNLHRKTTLKLPLENSSQLMPAGDESLNQQIEICEREILNRERTWLYCFILDRSLSAQMGKPYSIREDFIIRSSKSWHKHRFSVLDDSGITAMVDLHRIHSRILDTLYSDTCSNSGLNANLDYSLLMKTFSQSLDQWMTECTIRLSTSMHDPSGRYRHSMKDFYYHYYRKPRAHQDEWAVFRLFTMSFMLQHTLENPDRQIELPQVYLTCYDAATRVITIARDSLGPLGALRYAPDNQFVYIAYAAVFLLKLIRPQFQSFCDRLAVRNLVHDCTVLLDEVSVDETHTPALYAAFLRVLLNSKKDSDRPPAHVNDESRENGTRRSFASAEAQPGDKYHDEPIRRAERQDRHLAEHDRNAGQDRPAGLIPDPTINMAEPVNSHVPTLTIALNGQQPTLSDCIDQRNLDGLMLSHEDESLKFNQPNDYLVDSLLKDGGFWDSMLMPGYSGPLDALSGGAGLVSQFNNNVHDSSGFSFITPTPSGRVTPNSMNHRHY